MPGLLTEPPAIDPVYEARVYCNIPTIAERSVEGELCERKPQFSCLFLRAVVGNNTFVCCQFLGA